MVDSVEHKESLLSVVIPARNAEKVIGAQLAALTEQIDAEPFEVIVVDNQSTDRTVEVASSYTHRLDLRIVSAAATPSVPYARNIRTRAVASLGTCGFKTLDRGGAGDAETDVALSPSRP